MDERDFTVYQIHSVGFKPSGLAQQWIWFLSDPSLIFIIDSSWKTSGQLPPATLFYPSRKSPEGFGDSVKSRSIHPNQTQPTLLAAFEVQAGSAVLLRVPVWLLMSVSPEFPQLSAPLAQCERPKCPHMGFSEFTHLLQAFIHPLSLPFSIEEPLYSACRNQA